MHGFGGHERCAFRPFYQNEKCDGRHGNAAPDGTVAFQPLLIVEGENQAGYELNDGAAEKSHHD